MVVVEQSTAVVVAAQGLDETVGRRLHVDEVAAQRAGAVEHEHDHRALVFVDSLGVARGRELAVVLPLRGRLKPVPLLHVIGADLVADEVGEVLEREQVEDAFRRGGNGDARHASQAYILDVGQLTFAAVADVCAFDVALRIADVGHVIEGEADPRVGLLCRQSEGDVVERALVVELLRDLRELLGGLAHIVHLEDVVDGVARQLLEVVAEALDVADVGAAHADGVGRDVGPADEFVVDSGIDGSQIFATRVIAFGEHIGALVEAVGEGHHRDVDKILRDLGGGQAVEACVNGMVEDGAVLHGQAVHEIYEVVFCVLVQQPEGHSVEVAVEPDDAEIKAFLGRGVVLSLGFSATGESGKGHDKGQHSHR